MLYASYKLTSVTLTTIPEKDQEFYREIKSFLFYWELWKKKQWIVNVQLEIYLISSATN